MKLLFLLCLVSVLKSPSSICNILQYVQFKVVANVVLCCIILAYFCYPSKIVSIVKNLSNFLVLKVKGYSNEIDMGPIGPRARIPGLNMFSAESFASNLHRHLFVEIKRPCHLHEEVALKSHQ